MRKLRNLGLAGLVALGLTGCEDPTETQIAYTTPPQPIEVMQEGRIDKLPKSEKLSKLEGKIIKVQPSSVSYQRGMNEDTSSNHEFIYVVLEEQNKKTHTLIFPYSRAILERDATLSYVPLPLNYIDSDKFVGNFLGKRYSTNDRFVIHTEGFITPEGIKYKE